MPFCTRLAIAPLPGLCGKGLPSVSRKNLQYFCSSGFKCLKCLLARCRRHARLAEGATTSPICASSQKPENATPMTNQTRCGCTSVSMPKRAAPNSNTLATPNRPTILFHGRSLASQLSVESSQLKISFGLPSASSALQYSPSLLLRRNQFAFREPAQGALVDSANAAKRAKCRVWMTIFQVPTTFPAFGARVAFYTF
jgi:hypothetical protein